MSTAMVARESWSLVLPKILVGRVAESDRSESPEEVCPGSARGGKRQLAERIAEAAGRKVELVTVSDVHHSKELQREIAGLRLTDFFDDKGLPRFRRLGLTPAMAAEREDFGSRCTEVQQMRSGAPSAKARIMASIAAEKSAEVRNARNREVQERIPQEERLRSSDVAQRQIEVLFAEVPGFAQYAPPGVRTADVQPQEEKSRQDDARERRAIDADNELLWDKHWAAATEMNWLFTRTEALVLERVASLWTSAARGPKCPMGMDRSSFCRFLWDVGLVDQDRVPIFWAVSLFDAAARRVRIVPSPDVPLASVAPIAPIVSKWSLVAILDAVCRQHFTKQTKRAFLGSLLQIARWRLPEYILEESNLSDDIFATLAEGNDVLNIDAVLMTEYMLRPGSASMVASGAEAEAEPELAMAARPTEPEEGEARVRRAWRWNPYSGNPATQADIAREDAANRLLVHWMLLEPEVMHVVTMHSDLFAHLHRAYADELGDLPFSSFAQLCSDLRLSPEIASLSSLQSLYLTAGAVETLAPRGPEEGAGRRRSESRGRRGSSRPPSVSGSPPPASARPSPKPLSPRTPPGAAPHPPPSVVQRRRGSNAAPRGALAPSPAPAEPPSQPSSKPPSSRGSTEDSVVEPRAWPTRLPWQGFAEAARRAEEPRTTGAPTRRRRRLPAVFGPEALAESLCRVAFAHLGAYGSRRQQQMSPYQRVLWLVMYVRRTMMHLRASWDRRREALSQALASREASNHLGSLYNIFARCSREGSGKVYRRELLKSWRDTPGLAETLGVSKEFVQGWRFMKMVEEVFRTLDSDGESAFTFDDFREWYFTKAMEAVHPQLQRMLEGDLDALFTKPSLPPPEALAPETRVIRAGLPPKAKRPRERPRRGAAPQIVEPLASPTMRRATLLLRKHKRGSQPASRRSASPTETPPGDAGDRGVPHLGQPCVAGGVCRLCCRPAGPTKWGSPDCHGCAIVDALPLQRHPWRRLLVGLPPGVQLEPRAAGVPRVLGLTPLTPPALASSNALRSGAETARKVSMQHGPSERGRA